MWIVFETTVMVEITKYGRVGRERQMTNLGILQYPEAWLRKDELKELRRNR